MNFFQPVYLTKILVITSLVCVVSFFVLLVVANFTNRRGLTELNALQKESDSYESKLSSMEGDIATYSSLRRIEDRARELGFEKAKKVEYLK
jgi:cell division protein FtsL